MVMVSINSLGRLKLRLVIEKKSYFFNFKMHSYFFISHQIVSLGKNFKLSSFSLCNVDFVLIDNYECLFPNIFEIGILSTFS